MLDDTTAQLALGGRVGNVVGTALFVSGGDARLAPYIRS